MQTTISIDLFAEFRKLRKDAVGMLGDWRHHDE